MMPRLVVPSSAPGDTAADGRRSAPPAHGRPAPRSGCRLRSAAAAPAPAPPARAGPAGEFRPPRHDHPELRRDHIEPLGACLRRSPSSSPGSRGKRCPRAPASPRCAADAPAMRRGWPAAWQHRHRAASGSCFSASASPLAIACSSASRPNCNCSSGRRSRLGAELHPRQLQQQMAQPIVLCRQYVALR